MHFLRAARLRLRDGRTPGFLSAAKVIDPVAQESRATADKYGRPQPQLVDVFAILRYPA